MKQNLIRIDSSVFSERGTTKLSSPFLYFSGGSEHHVYQR